MTSSPIELFWAAKKNTKLEHLQTETPGSLLLPHSNIYQKGNTTYKAAESGKTFHVDDVEDDDDQGDSGRCGVGEGDVCAHEQAICQTPHVITTTVTHCASTQQTFSTPVWSCMVCR